VFRLTEAFSWFLMIPMGTNEGTGTELGDAVLAQMTIKAQTAEPPLAETTMSSDALVSGVRPTSPISIEPGVYRHYKGNYYYVIKVGRMADAPEKKVVVYADQAGDVWVRPVESWFEVVAAVGTTCRRFELLPVPEKTRAEREAEANRQVTVTEASPPSVVAPATPAKARGRHR
jgi:hypothetical protein